MHFDQIKYLYINEFDFFFMWNLNFHILTNYNKNLKMSTSTDN